MEWPQPWELELLSSGTTWTAIYEHNESHVIPDMDVVAHERDESCACQPDAEAVPRGDGTTGWLYTHSAWDGRLN